MYVICHKYYNLDNHQEHEINYNCKYRCGKCRRQKPSGKRTSGPRPERLYCEALGVLRILGVLEVKKITVGIK